MNDFEKLLGEKDGLGQIYSTMIQLFNDRLHELLPPIRGVMINKGYSYRNQRIKKRFKKFASDLKIYYSKYTIQSEKPCCI